MDYSQDPKDSGIISGSFNPSGGSHGPSKKLFLIVAGVVLVVVVAVVAFMAFRGNSSGPEGSAADIDSVVAEVNIQPAGMTPASIKVKVNQQVTITSADATPHQITADQDMLPGFDSTEVLNKGDSYTYTFDTKGTYHYYDPANPKVFTGTVIVE